ncbi:MAG: hypothetical protein L0206_11285, partial [Actinobacteria bacterium]|nr:hypothetical protein [Actinomycetota bacterium]
MLTALGLSDGAVWTCEPERAAPSGVRTNPLTRPRGRALSRDGISVRTSGADEVSIGVGGFGGRSAAMATSSLVAARSLAAVAERRSPTTTRAATQPTARVTRTPCR